MKKIAENIYVLFGYGNNCNGYLLKTPDGEGLLIDTGLGKFDSTWGIASRNTFKELIEIFDSENITKTILTHAHLDHIGGIVSLEPDKRKKISLYCHEAEKKYLEKPDTRYIDPIMSTALDSISIDHTLSNGNKITHGDFSFEILHTPGHTEGSMCLYDEEKKILFSGDCVFPEGSFGRVDFPGSNPEHMVTSLELLSSLNVNSLFAGHMDPILTNAKSNIAFSYINAKNIIL